ncbi:hypothetical protein D6V68_22530 [Escherichia albertii]|nr:hypothetical protein [Escherichia albertii]EEW7499331.1 hypothetical protein [Escherichia albertii]EFO0112173.1 hypothetical protein [Escherichia albertii]MLY53900.1 hypothetical protein [Escherichia albertii]
MLRMDNGPVFISLHSARGYRSPREYLRQWVSHGLSDDRCPGRIGENPQTALHRCYSPISLMGIGSYCF